MFHIYVHIQVQNIDEQLRRLLERWEAQRDVKGSSVGKVFNFSVKIFSSSFPCLFHCQQGYLVQPLHLYWSSFYTAFTWSPWSSSSPPPPPWSKWWKGFLRLALLLHGAHQLQLHDARQCEQRRLDLPFIKFIQNLECQLIETLGRCEEFAEDLDGTRRCKVGHLLGRPPEIWLICPDLLKEWQSVWIIRSWGFMSWLEMSPMTPNALQWCKDWTK